MERVILADKHGVTHWYIAGRRPEPGKNGKPMCNFGNAEGFVISETCVPPVPWPTCLLCAAGRWR